MVVWNHWQASSWRRIFKSSAKTSSTETTHITLDFSLFFLDKLGGDSLRQRNLMVISERYNKQNIVVTLANYRGRVVVMTHCLGKSSDCCTNSMVYRSFDMSLPLARSENRLDNTNVSYSFAVRPKKRLNKQWSGAWFEVPRRQCVVTVMDPTLSITQTSDMPSVSPITQLISSAVL